MNKNQYCWAVSCEQHEICQITMLGLKSEIWKVFFALLRVHKTFSVWTLPSQNHAWTYRAVCQQREHLCEHRLQSVESIFPLVSRYYRFLSRGFQLLACVTYARVQYSVGDPNPGSSHIWNPPKHPTQPWIRPGSPYLNVERSLIPASSLAGVNVTRRLETGKSTINLRAVLNLRAVPRIASQFHRTKKIWT
jgi:hypothetical protein